MMEKNRDGPKILVNPSTLEPGSTKTKETAMKKRNTSSPHWVRSTFLLLAVAATALFALATPAEALVAGNAKIVNTATVNWTGGPVGGVSASVTVTVNPVPSAPYVSTSATDPNVATANVYTLETTAQSLTYYVTNKGTGPDTLTVSDNNSYPNIGVSAATGAPGVAPTSLLLGATVTTAATTANGTNASLTVPSDGTTGTAVNNIEPDDYIVIGSNIYEVLSVTDNAVTNSATITLKTPLLADVPAGTQVGERGIATVAFTTGTLDAPPTEGTYAVTVTATSSATAPNTDSATSTVYVQRPNLTISKEVSTDGGDNFAASASADPGATLTYRITVTNNGTATANSVVITDPLPAFTAYVDDSAKYRTTTGGVYTGATTLDDDTAGSPDDGYDWGSTTLSTATYAIGDLAATASQVLYFQVTVNN